MRFLGVRLVIVALLALAGCHVSAQATVIYYFYEEIYNGSLAVYEYCGASNPSTDDYRDVEAGCGVNNPNGDQIWVENGGYQSSSSWAQTNQTTIMSGEWSGYASYELSMYEDCCDGNGNSYYVDTDGFSDVGKQECDSACDLYGSGDEEWLDSDPLYFAYSSAVLYVDPITVQMVPVSVSLDAGESQTFTADVAGIPEGYLSGITWTINGNAVGAGSTYTYIAPQTISTQSSVQLQACSSIAPVGCDTATIVLLAESVSIETPSPSVLLADGASSSYLFADFTNAPSGASVTWCSSGAGTSCTNITQTGDTTAMFTAPTVAAFNGANPSQPYVNASISASIANSNPTIPATPVSITIVQPVSISVISPATWTAGTMLNPLVITGAGFGTGAAVTVTISSTSWGAITGSGNCAAISNTSIQCPNIVIPANLSNMTGSQPVTITVSATTAGINTQAASTVNITPIAYTYSITLSSSATQLMYGGTSNIVPAIVCKVNGLTCAPSVSNPQVANFSVINGIGALSATSNANSTTFTATAMNSTPQTVTVQGCASIQTSSCATTTLNVAATSLTLSPATLSNPLTNGQSQSFSAAVQNPGTANQLTWTLAASPSGAAPGSMTSATSVITGTATSGTSSDTYNAPATVSTPTTVTLKACMTANTNICASPVTITLNPPPTFTVSTSGPAGPLSLGHSTSFPVTVSALYGFTGTVALSASGLSAGVTAQFSPASIATSGTSTLTLTSAYNASTYIGNSTITVSGASGGATVPVNAALTTRYLQYPCENQ